MNCYSNDRTILDGLELDIVIPSHKIAIEYCGLYWHDHNHKDKKYHQNKYKLSKEKGYILFTIFEDEWLHKSELVKRMISHKLNKTKNKIGARQTSIKNVDNNTVKSFLNENHIQSSVNCSYAYGLFYKNTLVALITLIKRNHDLEINRYCTSISVVGGFTKLLKHIKTIHDDIDKLYTFADLRWGYGDLYIKSGMFEVKTILPDYNYVKGNYRYHKFNFRHSKLKRKFENYDESKTEFENCIMNGYRRIYDCGKIKFSLDIKKSLEFFDIT